MQRLPHSLHESYEARPEAISRARNSLARFAAGAGASEAQVDDVRLAVSEAVTNAVLHGYRGGPGRVQVTAAITSGELWILISDDGCGMQPRADRPGLGLGLGLIAQICDDLSVVPQSAGGTELQIRFDLARSPLAARDGAGRPEAAGARVPLPDLT